MPPASLTLFAHAVETSAILPRLPGKGFEHEQTMPIVIAAPFGAFELVDDEDAALVDAPPPPSLLLLPLPQALTPSTAAPATSSSPIRFLKTLNIASPPVSAVRDGEDLTRDNTFSNTPRLPGERDAWDRTTFCKRSLTFSS